MPNGPIHTLAVLAALSLLPVSALAKRVPQHLDQSHWVHGHRHLEVATLPGRYGHAKEAKPKQKKALAAKKAPPAKLVKAAVKLPPKFEPVSQTIENVKVAEALKVEAPVSVVSVVRQTIDHPQVLPIEEAVTKPEIMPDLYDAGGRLNMPAAMRGSHDILVRQNLMAEQDGLVRIQDDEDLTRMREKKMLVPIPVNDGLRVDERLEENRRYCRPWVAQFLLTLAKAHYARFHTPLQVNSAVRTVSFQTRLMRTNGNAAAPDGEAASPHLTGQAIDIAKKELSQAEIAWMRLYLGPLQEDGKLDVEEEFRQACFHVSVYKKYAPASVLPPKVAVTRRSAAPAEISLE